VGEVAREAAVACSPGILATLLSNLLRNAIRHGTDGAPDPQPRVAVRAVPDGGSVRFEVEDHGPGVPEALREQIFELYMRGRGTERPGLGIGLATVKRMAETHGGDVGMRPADPQGSVFWFRIPRPRTQPENIDH
jgi:signal transduction histidine kinase